MATSGSKSVSATAHTTLRFSWSQSSQNVANNTTTISWVLEEIQTSGYISSSASKSWSVTVNGNNYSGTNTVGINSNSTRTLASGSTTIGHNADGTKSFQYSFRQQFDINYSGSWVGTKEGGASGTLNTIPRSSGISSTSANIGSAITININRASSRFTHTLRYSFHNLNATIVDKTSSTSYSWTIPTSFYAQIPNAKSSWGTIYCDTYSGSTKIGTTSCTFNAYVANSNPTLSPTVVDSNSTTIALTGDNSKFVKYYSNASFSVNASGKNSATIKSQKVTCGGKSSTNASGTLNSVESGKFVFTATDSRGFSTSKTINKTLINYIKPTCNLTTTLSADGVLVIRINGNYFNGSFGAKNNSLQVAYRYGIKGGSYGAWIYVNPTFSGNSYSVETTNNNLDYEQEYMVQAWCGDKFYENGTNGGVYSEEKPAFSKPIFDWGESDFNFNVPVTVNGNGKSILIGTGGSDVFLQNTSSGKYLQLKDDGVLRYDNNVIFNTANHGCKRLAQGAWHMNSSHSIGLSDTIWNQSHGIILVFSAFNPSSGETYQFDWHTYFVPKTFFTDRESAEGYVLITIFLTNPNLTNIGTKHLRVYNNKITGDDRNIQSGTGSGISFKNDEWVLRYVYGI